MKKEEPKPRPEKTDAELRKLAMDIHDGKVFTSGNIQNPSDLPMVFMVIALGGFANLSKEEAENIGLIYEYMDKAGPRSINGNPCFMSCRTLTKKETERLNQYYLAYKGLKDQFNKDGEKV